MAPALSIERRRRWPLTLAREIASFYFQNWNKICEKNNQTKHLFISENVCTPVCMLSPGLSVLMVRDALFVSPIGPANILLSMGTFVSKKQIGKR